MTCLPNLGGSLLVERAVQVSECAARGDALRGAHPQRRVSQRYCTSQR